MTDRELLQQALDALVSECDATKFGVTEAIRARLAQHNEFNPDWDAVAVMVEEQQRMAKELKTQREWQGLTDAEAEQIVDDYWHDVDMFIEAIEAKLKEKNNA
jgi:hypothetical protein